MRKIIVITTPGSAKKDFINRLSDETNGAVALVVIQKQQRKSFIHRLKKFIKKNSFVSLCSEIFYITLLYLEPEKRRALSYQKIFTAHYATNLPYPAPVMEVSDINEENVRLRIKSIKPDIIVIWGGHIVKSSIIELAPVALNIHTGYCPYYRGTNCNFRAILNGDFNRVGITIHDVVTQVDSGNIRAVVTAQMNQSPSSFFRELNDRAADTYISIITKILDGEYVNSQPQDLTLGKNYLLKDWSYAQQYYVGKLLSDMEHDRGGGKGH